MAHTKPLHKYSMDTADLLQVSDTHERLPASSISAVAGIFAPLLFCFIVTIAGLLRHDYNPVAQYISVLEQGHNAWVQNMNMIITGCLITAFAPGLQQGINGRRSSMIGTVLLMICSISSIFIGLTPMVIELIAGHLHNVEFSFILVYWTHLPLVVLAAGSLIVASFFLAWGMRRDPYWQSYEMYSLLTGSAVLVILCFYILAENVMPYPGLSLQERIMLLVKAECPGAGFVERLLLGIICLWIETLAIHLFSLPEAHRRGIRRRSQSCKKPRRRIC